MATTFWQALFQNFEFSPFQWKIITFLKQVLHFNTSFVFFYCFYYFLVNFGDFQRYWWRIHIIVILRHMTSTAHVADLRGNIFRRTISPLNFVVVALIFSELRAPPPPHPVPEVPPKSLVWIALNISYLKDMSKNTSLVEWVVCVFTNGLSWPKSCQGFRETPTNLSGSFEKRTW